MKSNSLVILLLMLLVKRLPSQETKLLPNKTKADIMLSDIRNAFKTVTNNTKLLNQIIPQMYESVIQKPKNTFSFEVPDESVKNGSIIWTMERDDLVDPIFPNLTSEFINEQLQKTRLTLIGNESLLHNDTTKIEAQSYSTNTWSTLGLEGWTGAIASDKVEPEESDGYPSSEILLDLDGKGHDNGGKDDGAVYIARVNDPFGSSVKWELRNSTERIKRDVLTLYSMIQCSTGCEPLIYKGYGCYCGFSGAGVPTDGIDRCCKLHDKCYEYSNCISYLEYFVPYVWKCYRHKPLCAVDHGEFGGSDSCAARLCQCDVQLSRCLRRFTCPKRRAICYTSRARRLQNLLLPI